MTLRTILVYLNSTSTAKNLLQSAAVLARRDNAHVIGLYVRETLVVYPGIAMHIPELDFASFTASQKAHAAELKAIFDAQTNAEDFPSEWRMVSSDTGFLADSIVTSARSVDLVIMAQEDGGDGRNLTHDIPERVIKKCGRPVLIVPRGYTAENLGDTVLLGWSETREATRAAHDLIPVASPHAKVRILRVGPPPSNTLADFAANDLAVTLARHGPSVEVMHRDKSNEKVPDILGHEAFEMGADIIATGAFGHSRAYDFVIGAATRSLLSESKLPVLFSK